MRWDIYSGMPIARIRGPVEDKGADWLIIGVGGVGVLASVPTSAADACDVGQSVGLYTHLHVREDALTLYGFRTREDLALFNQLISVSGVGPRVALGMLSAMEAPELAAAIVGGRSDVLKKVPGVGQKTAERIVLELRDKVTPPQAGAGVEQVPESQGRADQEVVSALMALGYSQAEAAAAADQLPTDGALTLEERVRAALQAFSRS